MDAVITPDDIARHQRYFKHCLQLFPDAYLSMDTSRITLAYFCVSALKLLGGASLIPTERVLSWLYRQQLTEGKHEAIGGFRGSFLGPPGSAGEYDSIHLAMTYCALCILKITGEDLSKVDRAATIRAVASLQCADGSFSACRHGGEQDLRCLYAACAICSLLNDWNGVDKEKAASYAMSCLSYEGAFGLVPGGEAHGGSTYCAVASLSLLGCLDVHFPPCSDARERLVRWCVLRRAPGYCGRINKPPDSCYAWWVRASLQLLGAAHWSDDPAAAEFVQTCRHDIGGFGKHPNSFPDILHSYFGVASLGLMGARGIDRPDPALGVHVDCL
eukprot:Rmarinus@m.16484